MGIRVLREVSKSDLEDWIYEIDLNDSNLYAELENPNMMGIFQLSGKTAERLKNEIHPSNFEEMNAVNAMARPGPAEIAPIYTAQKHGAKPIYPDAVTKLLSETYGVPIYDEQIMEIFHQIGGFDLSEVNEVRHLMKKLGKSEKAPEDLKKWDRVVKRFTRGAIKNEINADVASKLANDLASFSAYSFNKSHATSYSYIAAITLYLSFYFRKYFYASLLSQESDQSLLYTLMKTKAQGFNVLPPSVNESDLYFIAGSKNEIFFGLTSIKFVSPNASQKIIEGRPYSSLIDFIVKTRSRIVTSAVIKALISVGTFDFFDKNRKKLLFVFNKFWEKKKTIKVEEKLKELYQEIEQEVNRIPELRDTSDDLAEYERKYFGFRFFATSFTPKRVKAFEKLAKMKLIKLSFSEVGDRSIKVPVVVNSVRRFKDKNENEMAFVEIEDMLGVKEKTPIFHSYYQFIGKQFIEDRLYLLNLYKDGDEKIMFGKKSGWGTSEFVTQRMIKRIE